MYPVHGQGHTAVSIGRREVWCTGRCFIVGRDWTRYYSWKLSAFPTHAMKCGHHRATNTHSSFLHQCVEYSHGTADVPNIIWIQLIKLWMLFMQCSVRPSLVRRRVDDAEVVLQLRPAHRTTKVELLLPTYNILAFHSGVHLLPQFLNTISIIYFLLRLWSIRWWTACHVKYLQ